MQKGCISNDNLKIKNKNLNKIKALEDMFFLKKLFFPFDNIIHHQNQGVFKLRLGIII
jgi:hypothetical protein